MAENGLGENVELSTLWHRLTKEEQAEIDRLIREELGCEPLAENRNFHRNRWAKGLHGERLEWVDEEMKRLMAPGGPFDAPGRPNISDIIDLL